MSSTSDEYVTVRLPKELMDEVDEMIRNGVRGYKSRAEFIKEAIRKRCEELAANALAEIPVLEHFNVSEQGVRILDRSLQSKSSRGRIIDVYFKPDNAWCDYCESSNCNHVRFALNLKEVQETLKKKGWKIKQ
jgi:Arc/MetJ-type ribon-helix-helix transcriptional regulator